MPAMPCRRDDTLMPSLRFTPRQPLWHIAIWAPLPYYEPSHDDASWRCRHTPQHYYGQTHYHYIRHAIRYAAFHTLSATPKDMLASHATPFITLSASAIDDELRAYRRWLWHAAAKSGDVTPAAAAADDDDAAIHAGWAMLLKADDMSQRWWCRWAMRHAITAFSMMMRQHVSRHVVITVITATSSGLLHAAFIVGFVISRRHYYLLPLLGWASLVSAFCHCTMVMVINVTSLIIPPGRLLHQ